jgi:O-antigen ligase
MPRPSAASPAREPVRRPRLWVLVGIMILAGIPWYVPTGTIEPLVLGLPAWFWVSVLAAVGLSATVCWACLTQWRLEDVEDTVTRDAADEVPDDHRGADR